MGRLNFIFLEGISDNLSNKSSDRIGLVSSQAGDVGIYMSIFIMLLSNGRNGRNRPYFFVIFDRGYGTLLFIHVMSDTNPLWIGRYSNVCLVGWFSPKTPPSNIQTLLWSSLFTRSLTSHSIGRSFSFIVFLFLQSQYFYSEFYAFSTMMHPGLNYN